MKFNYFKVAKENGYSDENFFFAQEQKYEYGNSRYMAAHWLAWSYQFLRCNEMEFFKRNLQSFLEEIERICEK